MTDDKSGNLERRDSERHILAAVDSSENSKRAIMYLADFFGDYRNIFITVLSIIREPSEDFFADEEERRTYLNDKKKEMEKVLEGYRRLLLEAGLGEEQIQVRLVIRRCDSIADAILEEQQKLKSCIVVVGRRGLSHKEEFVFGSTSNKILHHAQHCAVMVIE